MQKANRRTNQPRIRSARSNWTNHSRSSWLWNEMDMMLLGNEMDMMDVDIPKVLHVLKPSSPSSIIGAQSPDPAAVTRSASPSSYDGTIRQLTATPIRSFALSATPQRRISICGCSVPLNFPACGRPYGQRRGQPIHQDDTRLPQWVPVVSPTTP